ncbi:MAG: hypothetical protein ACQEVA_10110 [Myxococcota bacterium]
MSEAEYMTNAEEFLEVCNEGGRRPYTISASADTWRRILEEYPALHSAVALNKTIPEEIIRELSRSEDSSARSSIARTRRTPLDVLESLAQDSDASVRKSVVANPEVPREILESLRDDPWVNIREFVAKRLRKFDGGDSPSDQ